MYNLQKNNYHLKPKPSNIQTPLEVSWFIYELLRDKIDKRGVILDPCCGQGNLLKPWKESDFWTYGIDVEKNSSVDLVKDFLVWNGEELRNKYLTYSPRLRVVLCNPPFNGYGNKLSSEVWLDKILKLFGKDIPIVLFTPVGFRVNLTRDSNRWKKLNNGDYPKISSLITLPKNIFEGVIFHSEILIFNIPNLQPHYFLKTCPN